MTDTEKFMPKIGDQLSLHIHTMYACDPYTVIGVDKNQVIVQEAQGIFEGTRYFDSIPVEIIPNPNGEVKILKWSKKFGAWVHTLYSGDKYPEIASFGHYRYVPYVD